MILIAWLAFAIDCVCGDPRTKYHPVVLIGNFIAFLERMLLNKTDTAKRKMVCGAALVAIVLSCVYSVTMLITVGIAYLGLWGVIIGNAVLLWVTITPRSLADAGREIRDYLLAGDLANARYKVGWIVGRDTDRLDEAEVTRATVETIAENIVDGIISPLFYFFIGGAPLAFLYRAANTMDSMIAYKNEKYLYFGRVAAYLDDALNYIPARLTAGLIVAVAYLLQKDHRAACRIMRRDAAKHPSPNGGYTEATVAGALHIRLGGLNYYFGAPSQRALMGDPIERLAAAHITATIRIMYGVTLLFLGIVSVLGLGG